MSKEKEFIEFVIKSLVDEADAVSINLIEGEKTNVLEIKASVEDYGKIIGKRGRVVNAIRVLLGIVGRESGKRWVLDVPNKQEESSEIH